MPQLLTGCHPACVMASAVWPPSWEERAGSGKLMMSLLSAVYTGSLATRALEEEEQRTALPETFPPAPLPLRGRTFPEPSASPVPQLPAPGAAGLGARPFLGVL